MEYRYSSYRSEDLREYLRFLPLDVAFIGPSGVGKSTTINQIFGENVAKVGEIEPETIEIQQYQLNDNLRVWDTPGYGDSTDNDEVYIRALEQLLTQRFNTKDGKFTNLYLIDFVILFVDASSRDLGTVNWMIQKIVDMGFPDSRIILVANRMDLINQHGKTNPEKQYERGMIVTERIKASTKIQLNIPVFFSAVGNENINLLIDEIIDRSKIGNRAEG